VEELRPQGREGGAAGGVRQCPVGLVVQGVDDPVGETAAGPEVLDVDDAIPEHPLREHLVLGGLQLVVDDQVRPGPPQRLEIGGEVGFLTPGVTVRGDEVADELVAVLEQELKLLVGKLVR
jgi:hypothetical protein